VILLFALWVKQGPAPKIADVSIPTVTDTYDAREKLQKTFSAVSGQLDDNAKKTPPLHVPFVPQRITDLVANYNGGLAGALLLLSGFFSGKRLGLCCWIGAILIIGSRLDIPMIEGKHWLAAAIGTAVMLLGVLAFRKTPADG
jgi:hypothetical protein